MYKEKIQLKSHGSVYSFIITINNENFKFYKQYTKNYAIITQEFLEI